MFRDKRQHQLVVLFSFAVLFIFNIPNAYADLWHVQTIGTRTTGSSLMEDWTPENCYPTLAAATALAAAGDTILLDNEIHLLNETVTLAGFLGNRNLGGLDNDASLECGPLAQLILGNDGGAVEVRGLVFTGDGSTSDQSLFVVENGVGTLVSATFEACGFTNMDRTNGSGIDASASGEGAELNILSCVFENNSTVGEGGAIAVGNAFQVDIFNSQFIGNSVHLLDSRNQGKGGAIAVFSPDVPSSVTIDLSFFSGNQSSGPGGALFIEDANVNLANTEFTGNLSAAGGLTNWAAGAAVMVRRQEHHLEDLSLTVQDCVFTDNKGDLSLSPWAGDGGGIAVRGYIDRPMSVTVSDSEFRGNFNAQGAGIFMGYNATGKVERCSFHDNVAYLQGGACFKGGAYPDNIGETMVFEYCEFVGNKAGQDDQGQESTDLGRGGAFSTRLATRGEFYNCTFVNNVVSGPIGKGDAIMHPAEGGVFDSDDLRCVIVNCAFYGTEGNNVQVFGHENAFSQVSNNAWEAGQFLSVGVVPTNTVELVGMPFISLEDLHLPSGSPLIDVALDVGLTQDIEMNPVPNLTVPDIGAYESEFAVAPVQDEVPASAPVLSAYPNPFNPRTTLSFELTRDSQVSVEVFDIQGRRVSMVETGHRPAGLHRVDWNGMDDNGRALPSGVYHAVLRLGNEAHTRKLTLVR